jgi:hypothetical protein
MIFGAVVQVSHRWGSRFTTFSMQSQRFAAHWRAQFHSVAISCAHAAKWTPKPQFAALGWAGEA